MDTANQAIAPLSAARAAALKDHTRGYHAGHARPDCDGCAADEFKAAARVAVRWAVDQPAPERSALIDGHRARRVEHERGGLVTTDYAAADAWLIAQHAEAIARQ